MALNPKFSDTTANAQAAATSLLLNSGKLRLYTGSQPANANTALSGQTLLAELTFNATAAPAPSAGLLTFNPIADDTSADATGTAAWLRALKSDGTTVVMDGSVIASPGTADMVMNSTAIQIAADVGCTAFTLQISEG